MNKKYDISIKEAIEILGLSDTSIRRLIKSGRLSKRYEKAKRGKIIKLSLDEITKLKEERDKLSPKVPKEDKETVGLGAYNELEKRYIELQKMYNELQQRHEVVVYKLGASETRTKELEREAESLRKTKKGIWDRIKDWWRSGK